MPRDPVCGKEVDALRAPAVAIVGEEIRYFCCAAHKEEFLRAPAASAPHPPGREIWGGGGTEHVTAEAGAGTGAGTGTGAGAGVGTGAGVGVGTGTGTGSEKGPHPRGRDIYSEGVTEYVTPGSDPTPRAARYLVFGVLLLAVATVAAMLLRG
jgi:YHS domain-containing protein